MKKKKFIMEELVMSYGTVITIWAFFWCMHELGRAEGLSVAESLLVPCPNCGYDRTINPEAKNIYRWYSDIAFKRIWNGEPFEPPFARAPYKGAIHPGQPKTYRQPLAQFESFNVEQVTENFWVTNMVIYLVLLIIIVFIYFKLISWNLSIIPKNAQTFFESVYNFVFTILKQQLETKGYVYFPLILCLFLFILDANLVGMCLYSFTVTSHIIVAFMLSFGMFLGILLIGIIIQRFSFLLTFVPQGAPKILTPFLTGIEIISYFSRPFSLGIRLFANLMSGHTLLAILANFAFLIFKNSLIIAIIPIILITAIVGLEAMIAVLQAYVFTVLVCIYLNESLLGAH